MLKDYYKILEVGQAASSADIKKSYRRLALQYHPDKNFGNTMYEAKFKEISEAYSILSDLKQRQEYNIKIKFSQGEKKKTAPLVTAAALLQQAVDFRKKIAYLDPERINRKALYNHILHLLSKPNIHILLLQNDPRLNKRIINEMLFCAQFLPHVLVEKICFQLTALAGTDNMLYRRIYKFSRDSKRREIWNKYKLPVAILIALVFCLLIYVISESY